MRAYKTSLLTISLLVLGGCSSWQPMCPDNGFQYRICPQGTAQSTRAELAARLAALEKDHQALATELATTKRESGSLSDRVKSLEAQLTEREREIAGLRSSAGDSSRLASQLTSAQNDVDQSRARISELERQLASAQSKALTDTERLGAELATAQSQLAALQPGAGEKDQLAKELATAKQRMADLEAQLNALSSNAEDKTKLAADLVACTQQVAQLERQLADRNKELAELRGDLSSEMAKLREAQRGLIKALRPQIDKGNIMVDLNNERLLINLASGYLFGSGEDQLKPAGADALKQVGSILKDFPEYKVAVDGHTDNRPIRSALKKKFPTNKELSEARAANAASALIEGGLGAATTHGYADTKPIAPNTTNEGRAQNRRVEVRVTK